MRIDAAAAAALVDRVDDRAALSRMDVADEAPGFGLCFHRLGIEDLFDDGKVFGQSRKTLFAGTGSTLLGETSCFNGGRRGDGGDLQEQFELRGIDLLAARAKGPSHECINFLAQERVLLVRGGEHWFQRDDALPQLGQFGL